MNAAQRWRSVRRAKSRALVPTSGTNAPPPTAGVAAPTAFAPPPVRRKPPLFHLSPDDRRGAAKRSSQGSPTAGTSRMRTRGCLRLALLFVGRGPDATVRSHLQEREVGYGLLRVRRLGAFGRTGSRQHRLVRLPAATERRRVRDTCEDT